MDVISAIPEDERALSVLACNKLKKILQGTVSIGQGLCLSDVKGSLEPHVFLERQFDLIRSFIKVIGSVSLKINSVDALDKINSYNKQFNTLFEQFKASFLSLCNHQKLPLQTLNEEGDKLSIAYDSLVQIITEYTQLLGGDSPTKHGTLTGRQMTEAFLRDAIESRCTQVKP